MVKYLDGKDAMSPDEKELLMFALYVESKTRRGLAFEGTKELERLQRAAQVQERK